MPEAPPDQETEWLLAELERLDGSVAAEWAPDFRIPADPVPALRGAVS